MLQLSVILTTLSFVLSHGHYECGTVEYNAALLTNDPDGSWQREVNKFETEWAARSAAIQAADAEAKAKGSRSAKSAASAESSEFSGVGQSQQSSLTQQTRTITIPIIFHIVMQNPWSFPDNAIAYQLQRLNADFAATNRDYTSGTPSEFQPVRSGDTGIRFVNAGRINRQTWVTAFSQQQNNIKFDSTGGSNVRSPDRFLNIWVGALQGRLLGYAQFPDRGSPATDGVVIIPNTLAPSVATETNHNIGRNAVHEVGHWLMLRHVWGDDSTCTNTANAPDYVVDTPPARQNSWFRYTGPGCPWNLSPQCRNHQYSQDMWMNHMDYGRDQCKVMFTQQQSERMWWSLFRYRQGFVSRFVAQTSFVNSLYFNRSPTSATSTSISGVQTVESAKCYGDDVLFYENDLNEESASDIKIYGCLAKTTNMNIGHITDIKFVYAAKKGEAEDYDEGDAESKCDDGYTQATQDLNEGNDGDSIYLCYKKEDSVPDRDDMAILDITVIKDDDVSKLDMNEWEMNEQDNINPNGVKLNFAFKRGTYYVDDDMISGDEQEAICNALRADDCGNEVDEKGDHLCGYNKETGVCYAVVRRAGINGDGNYDDGFIDAENAGKAEADKIYLIVFVFCGVILVLLICMVCGGCYLYQKSKQNALKHDHQDVQWMKTAIAMGQIMNVQRFNQVQETKECQE